MSRSFEDIIGDNASSGSRFGLRVSDPSNTSSSTRDLTDKVTRIEVDEELNEVVKMTAKIQGDIGKDEAILLGNEMVVTFDGSPFAVGIIQNVKQNSESEAELIGRGYGSALNGKADVQFNDTNTDDIVNTLIDGTDSVTGKTINVDTNERLNTSANSVVDFRAKKKQLKDVTRLIGEFGGEWFISFDNATDLTPSFNVVQQRGGGQPVKTFATREGASSSGQDLENNAKFMEVETDDTRGSFKQVVVNGFGEGDDQIQKVADDSGNIISSPVQGERTLVYTDKTIISESQAERRAKSLADTHTVTYKTVKVEPDNPNQVFQVGDVVRVQDEDAGVFDDTGDISDGFRVVRRYYKIRFDKDSKLELELSNKPKTFLSEFKKQQNLTKGETDHQQGARNIHADKESANASPSQPLKHDFEVPKDVKDLSGKNRLNRVSLAFNSEEIKQSADAVGVTADNFNPSVKAVSTDVKPGGVEIENGTLSQHGHATASSTSVGGAGSSFVIDDGVNFSSKQVPSNGWVNVAGRNLLVNEPEEDLAHRIRLEFSNISSTSNLHFAVLAGGPVASFSFSPDPAFVGAKVQFENESTIPDDTSTVAQYELQTGDGTTLTSPTAATTFANTYQSTGTFTATLRLLDASSNEIDSTTRQVEVLPATQGVSLSEMEGEPDDLQKRALDEVSGDEAFETQDANIARGDPGNNDVFNTRVSDNITFDGSVVSEDESGEIRVFLLKDDGNDNFDHQFPIQPAALDTDFVPQASSSFDFQDFEMTGDIETFGGGDPFRGPGEYGYMLQFEQDGDGFVKNDTRDDSFFIYTYEMEFVQPNQGDTINSSTVDFEFEVVAGEGGSDVDLLIDGTQEQSFGVDGFTLSVQGNDSETITVDGEEVTFDTVSVDNSTPDADLSITGVTKNQEVGDTFTVNNQKFKVTNIAERSGTYEEVTLEPVFVFKPSISGISDGQHTARIEGTANNTDPRNDELITDEVDFEVSLNDPPTASFNFSPSNPSANQVISFDDTSTDPDGNNTIQRWEWDFGDGTAQTIDTGNSGDTSKSYTSSGTFTVSLEVFDDKGVSNSTSQQITVGQGDALQNTVAYTGVDKVGASTSTSTSGISGQALTNSNTVTFTGVSSVGTQKTPAGDLFLKENFDIPYNESSSEYEVYVASQGSASPTITGRVLLNGLNHTHDLPRQDDFAGRNPEVGGGAENKEIEYKRASGDRGSLLVDFSERNESVTLDTTLNGNDLKVTVAEVGTVTASVTNINQSKRRFDLGSDVASAFDDTNTLEITGSTNNDAEYEVLDATFDGSVTKVTVKSPIPDKTLGSGVEAVINGVLSREETISANNGTATTSNLYQDSELFVRIESANNQQPFLLENATGDNSIELEAASPERFRAAKTEQNTDNVEGDDGGSQDLVESVDPGLLGGSSANNFRVFLDPTPDSGSNTEQEITGELFNGASNSGAPKAKDLDLLAAAKAKGIDVTSPGFKRLKLEPDQPTFVKSRVTFGHHKDSKNESGSSQ